MSTVTIDIIFQNDTCLDQKVECESKVVNEYELTGLY